MLPVDAVLPELCAALERGPCAVLAAPPGAGKTTRVPLALLDAPWRAGGRIVMLEPRRIAARAAAERLAEQLGERPGGRVGYRIRGETRPGSAIEVVTEGVLTRMLQSEPDLPGVAAVIFDEVHERSLNGDFGLALALEVQRALRPDLRLLAMSATLDTAAFADLMDGAPVIESAGRMFPVETRWLDHPWRQPRERPFDEAAAELVRAALAEGEGDVLVFLPGAGEIERVRSRLGSCGAAVVPLYGALPFAEQRRALAAGEARRVILATSIAETSLTVEGVRTVVDCGRARRARVDPGTGLSRLVTVPVSRAEADQRRGRAGRLGPGLCLRMWTRAEEGALPEFAPPEIMEADLTPLALELAAWGAADPAALPFLTPPPEGRYAAARDLLTALGALDEAGRITEHGRALAGHPVHPRLAHMLTLATPAEVPTAATLAALMSERDPMPGAGADLGLRLRALAGGRPVPGLDRTGAERVRATAKTLGPGRPNPEAAPGLLAMAYPDRIALRRPGDQPRYLLSGGRGAVLDPADALAGQRLLVTADLDDGREARIRRALAIGEGELRTRLGTAIRRVESAEWSPRTRRVETRRREMLGALALSDEPWADAPPDRIADALAKGLRTLGPDALPWSAASRQLRERVRWLKDQGGAMAETLPDWSDAGLAATLDTWLAPFLPGCRQPGDIAPATLTEALRAALGPMTREVDRAAPTHFTTPLGSRLAIAYDREVPVLAVRVQEMFGTTIHPTAGDPPIPLLLDLLSPAGRPVQTTRDLPGFWASSYADVRRDMRARYPKHPWPEDPASAEPTRRAKPRR